MAYPIPNSALDADIAVLGRKGGGKTYTSKGIVERLLDMGRRVLVLDPLGVWAGLRTSADGEGPGYPVAIFGGPHADMPLDTAAAVAMADVLARENVPAVIDLSELTKGVQQSFLLAFLHELRRVNTEALTIVLEEADVFAPQNPQGDDSKQLHHEIDWIARRGRVKGFRLITICQRPARLSKDVLTQAATLVAHRLPAPQDRDAVKAWVEGNGDREAAKGVYDTLATLAVGEAWVWASEESTLERQRFPAIKTLDTSATPKAGEKRKEPKTLADVDVSAIRSALDQASKQTTKTPKNIPENITAMIQAAEQRGYEKGWAAGNTEGRSLVGHVAARELTNLREAVDKILSLPAFGEKVTGEAPVLTINPRQAAPIAAPVREAAAPKPLRVAPVNGFTAPQIKVLRSLMMWRALGNDTPSKVMVAGAAGYSPNSSGYRNLLGSLRAAGAIDYPQANFVRLLTDGIEPMAAAEARDALLSIMSNPQRKIFDALLSGGGMSKETLAEVVGYQPTSSGYRNLLGSLRALSIVEYPQPGHVALSAWVEEVMQ